MPADSDDPEVELEDLLEFFYRIPVGLIEFDDRGAIGRVNAAAVNLISPRFEFSDFVNVFEVVGSRWPNLTDIIARSDTTGHLVDDHQIIGTDPDPWALVCSVIRLGSDRNTLVVTDGTSRHRAEKQRDELLVAERAARNRIEILERNATRIASATTIEDVVRAVLDELASTVGRDMISIDILNGESVRVLSERDLLTTVPLPNETVAITSLLPGPEAIRLNDTVQLYGREEIAARFPEVNAGPTNEPAEAILAVPLRAADKEAVGALVMVAPDPALATQNTLLLLSSIADQTGQAIERAQLYDQVVESQRQQRAIALRLQAALLPDQIVESSDVAIATRYRAASEAMMVGGDWYDTFAWPDGRIGVVVGDVVGHDLEATATMGRLRAAMAALAPRLEPSPGDLLTVLAELAAGPDGTDYATACCVVFDPASRTISYASAGHPPPLVVGQDDACRWLDDALSVPIGTFPGVTRPTSTTTLAEGSVVVIYSDGLVERRGADLNERLERLRSVATSVDRRDLDTFTDHLMAEMTEDDSLEDDVICLAVGWRS